ncbi:MYND-type domain-containing protein [Mycena kentingensis (nom. inval.)]|nr:MYND-type domain-containing protein [Mycena kentingensis (nom. inval.)]
MHPSLHPSSLSKLPISVRKFAQDAVDGSTHGYEMCRASEEYGGIPQGMHRLLLAVYYAALDNRYIDDIRAGLRDGADIGARLATIVHSMQALTPYILDRSLPDIAVQEIWARAWPWIKFLHEHMECIASQEYTKLLVYYAPAMSLMYTYVEHDRAAKPTPSFDFASAHPWVLSFAARAWSVLLEFERLDLQLGSAQARLEGFPWMCVNLISFVYHDLAVEDTEHIRQFIDGAGGSYAHLGALIIRHLDQTCPKTRRKRRSQKKDAPAPVVDKIFIERVNGVLILVPADKDYKAKTRSELRAALMEAGLTKALTRVACTMSTSSMATTTALNDFPALLLRSVMTCIAFDPKPQERLAEALKAGILRCAAEYVCRGNVHEGDLYHEEIRWILQESIPVHSTYLSVLRPLLTEMAHLEATYPDLAQGMATVGLAKQWAYVVELTAHRKRVVIAYDGGRLTSQRACDSLACGKIADAKGYRRCSSCRDAWYCSPSCQKSDWAGGHRKNCAAIEKAYTKYSSEHRTSDRKFHRALLNYDYAANQWQFTVALVPHLLKPAHLRPVLQFDYRWGLVKCSYKDVEPEWWGYDDFRLHVQRAATPHSCGAGRVPVYPHAVVGYVGPCDRLWRPFLLRFSEPKMEVALNKFLGQDPARVCATMEHAVKEIMDNCGPWTH